MRRALVGLALVAAGCETIPATVESPAPVNTCMVTADCAALSGDGGTVVCASVGDGGVCQVAGSPPYILIVNVPTLAAAAAGTTYAIASNDLFVTRPMGDPNYCTAPSSTCFRLAPLVSTGGAYVASNALAIAADRRVNAPNVTADVTLPVSVTFFPQWTPPGTTTPVDVRYLNLPLPPVYASVGGGAGNFQLSPSAYPPGSSSSSALPIEWVAGLPPLPGADWLYDGVVDVSPPFDDGFPDLGFSVSESDTLSPNGPYFHLPYEVTILQEPASGLTVVRSDGKPLGAGWTVGMRDQFTQAPLSPVAVLRSAETTTRINVFEDPAETNVEFVVQPPPGAVKPELVSILPTIPAGLSVSYAQLPNVTYPVLPPLVRVSGKVLSAEKAGVASSLLFYSTAIDTQAACRTGSFGASGASGLFYEARVATSGSGDFTIDLPQGAYAVVIDPTPASGYAKTTLESLEARAAHACTGGTRSLRNVVLAASHRVTVTGQVATADGRPLANAEVDFTPAAALYAGLNPAANTTNPFAATVAEDRWPRPFSASTDTGGRFTIEIDPEAAADPQYDVTVKPQPGTGFPWVVRADHIYAEGAPPVSLVVPAPFVATFALHDPSDNPLVNAVVEAYTFTPTGVAVPIAQAVTDENGTLTLTLTTSLASN